MPWRETSPGTHAIVLHGGGSWRPLPGTFTHNHWIVATHSRCSFRPKAQSNSAESYDAPRARPRTAGTSTIELRTCGAEPILHDIWRRDGSGKAGDPRCDQMHSDHGQAPTLDGCVKNGSNRSSARRASFPNGLSDYMIPSPSTPASPLAGKGHRALRARFGHEH